MDCSYCGGHTRWTEKFCGGTSIDNVECGAPMHRPDCNTNGEIDCTCPKRPFQDGEIDKYGKVFRENKGWVKE